MSTSTANSLRAAAAALVVLAAAGCSAAHHRPAPPATPSTSAASGPGPGQSALPTGRAGTPAAGLPAHVDSQDATAVAAAAITADWTWDTALDTSPADAQRRSQPWLTPQYAAQVAHAPTVAAPGAQWDTLAAHHGYTTAALARAFDDPTADTATSAWREFTVTVTEHGRDGWHGPVSTYVQYAHLTRPTAGAPWQVDQMRVAQ